MTCRSARCSAIRWRRSRAGRARRYVALTALAVARARGARRRCSPMTGVSPLIYVAHRGGGVRAAAAGRRAADGAGAARAARALDRSAHGHRQYPPAERADADHRAVARPRHRAAGHRDRDRRQPAPAVLQRTAGKGAVVLFSRYSRRPGRALRHLRARACAVGNAGRSADAARAYRFGRRHAGRKHQATGRRRLGAAKRPRHHLRQRYPDRLAAGRRAMVGHRLRRAAAGLIRKTHRRRPRPQARRSDRRQRARPQHHRDHRQHAHGRLGKPRDQFRHGVFAERFRAARRTRILRR